MRLALFGKAVSPEDAEALRQALDRVLTLDAAAWIHQPYMSELSDHMELPHGLQPFEGEVPEGVEVLLAFGGDGTVLEAATMVRSGAVPILGVNTGRLGFLSNVSMEAFDLAMDALVAGTTWEEERALLHVSVDGLNLGPFPYALNEVVIHKRDTASMVVVDVHRDDTFVNTYWADGLLVSTPTGYRLQLERGRAHCVARVGRGCRDTGGAAQPQRPTPGRALERRNHFGRWRSRRPVFVEHGQPIVPFGARPGSAHSPCRFPGEVDQLGTPRLFFHGSTKNALGT